MSLSEKQVEYDPHQRGYFEEDVKEFIKREWFLIAELMDGTITNEEFVTKRDKLAGKDLC